MPSLKALRRRVRTVKNTQLITRAMRSVAATKMRRTQDRRERANPYVRRLQELVASAIASAGVEGQPLLERRERERSLVVVFSSDRGLCGAFNNIICRYGDEALRGLPEDTGLYVIGKRAGDYFRKRGRTPIKTQADFGGNIDLPRILEIARELRDLFLSGEYDRVELIYNRAISALSYRPARELFLPLREDELRQALGGEESGEAEEPLDYIYEPAPKTLLSVLLPKYVETKILFTFVDAFAAEHQARMMAMSAANENCKELMESLTLQFNKVRQTTITKEILEIVSGAEALRG